jgi:chemotaxis protein MotB
MRRRDRSKQQAGSPLWMTTYADLITNLLVLFVLLYAFSELDVQRFQSVITSFQAYAGVLSGGLIQEGHRLLNDSSRDEIVRILEEFVRQRQLQTVVAVVPSAEGITLRFLDRVLFDSGRAELRPEARELLSDLAGVLAQMDNHIRIEGHTDNVPIHNAQFPSNWELSVYRASTVVRFMEDVGGIDSHRLSAVGYGEYRPIGSNQTAAGRQRNRRVDIIILDGDADELPAAP